MTDWWSSLHFIICHLNSLGALSLGGRSLFFLCCLCLRFRQRPCSLLCFCGLLSFQEDVCVVLVVIFSFGRQVHDRLNWQGQVREQHAGKGFIRNLTLHGHTTNQLAPPIGWLLWSRSPSCVMFSMPIKVKIRRRGLCCWEEEEEEEEEL